MNGRTNIVIAAMLAALVTGLGTVSYFQSTTISEQDVREAQIRHDAADEARYKALQERLERLSDKQIEMLQELAANEVSRMELERRIGVLEAALNLKRPN